ncbi:2-octaprenyl-6-methoxyphenyl hydroxylase [Methylophaga sp. OBS3]|uniref:2-octaprenyl-6-methoxyphenyl hydroxylase n=1 Tax=Methylophaga sp. OBS3 TaxID=2991934 RepID=UPI00225579CC|nr:2-octaprenyl-6-methoxyphenyl hydroxylase [Methylophaga sp. OBS3]MCX4188716.1 2-octaprenyl-6-methoxyphenyl hydroxylase [Methylophaga sp. OBS3]
MSSVEAEFDVVIVGAGMVGTSLALALKNTSLKVGIIETHSIAETSQPSYDDRGIALSYGSQQIFQSLGLWADLKSHATPILDIHISDRGHFGVTRLSAQTSKVPALGQVLTAKQLGQQLNVALQQNDKITLMSPVSVTQVETETDYVTVTLSNQQKLRSRLLVAADGQHSTIRNLLSLGTWQRDYQQTAITANVSTERPHQNRAFERFTDTGPLALLPMSDNRCSLVWTVTRGQEEELLNLTEKNFMQALQQRFGFRLGHFTKVGKRSSYPLGLMQTDNTIQPRVLLIGNAAHSLHPIAGQGFNLGLRDAAVLAEAIKNHAHDCGHPKCLLDYQQWQLPTQDKVVKATDRLVKLFSNANPLLGHGRSAALALLDILPPIKQTLSHSSMGLSEKQSRLSRGLSL